MNTLYFVPRRLQSDYFRTFSDHLKLAPQTLKSLLTQLLLQILRAHFQTFLHNLNRFGLSCWQVVQVKPSLTLLLLCLFDQLDLLLHRQCQLLILKRGVDDRVILRRVICHDGWESRVCAESVGLKVAGRQTVMRLLDSQRGFKWVIWIVDTMLFLAFHNSHGIWVHFILMEEKSSVFKKSFWLNSSRFAP